MTPFALRCCAVLLFCIIIDILQAATADESLVVEIDTGLIRGGVGKSVRSGKEYYYFRGIPFAKPPVGNLRFGPPVPVGSWNGTLNTTKDAQECVQGTNPVTGSEDCLYINVYTPQKPTPKTNSLAVMVYIYGGTFISGSSKYTDFGPDYFLDDGVIVVTLNYRVGIFGFLSTGDLVAPGNAGLKDQTLALRWVQRNIAHFGGNPNNVTLFGESAGSASVAYHLQSNLSKGLFHGAILESGSSLCLWSLSRYGREAAFAVGSMLDLNVSSSEALLLSLRKVKYDALQNVSTIENLLQLLGTNPRDGLIFAPVVEPEHKGAFFTGKSFEMLSKGQFHRVPAIIGFNSKEGSTNLTLPMRLYVSGFVLNVTKLVPIDMHINNAVSRITVGLNIRYRYFGFTPLVGTETDDVIQFISDDQFNRPIRKMVELYSKFAPVYFYKFSYEGPLGGVKYREVQGVRHAEELNYLWVRNRNATTQDKLVRSRMVRLWTNFAKFRRPTVGVDALFGNVTWPVASPSPSADTGNLTYLDIGASLAVKKNPFQENLDYWEDLYKKNGNRPYDTY